MVLDMFQKMYGIGFDVSKNMEYIYRLYCIQRKQRNPTIAIKLTNKLNLITYDINITHENRP